jgi:hypothetical protein
VADVFISYASEDRDRARSLAKVLETGGLSVWWDRKIVPGQSFDQTIERELDAAKSAVVLWSTASISSGWVKSEASAARQRGILVPAMIDDVKIPLGFRDIQCANLVGWSGDPANEEYQSLRSGLQAVMTIAAPVKAAVASQPSAVFAQPSPISADKKAAAVAAAQRIMTNLANRQYSELWDAEVSEWTKKQMPSKESFLANMSLSRAPLGILQQADLIDVNYSNRDPATGYQGDIFVVRFSTIYNNCRMYEQVVVIDEGDEWKASGFFWAPAPGSQMPLPGAPAPGAPVGAALDGKAHAIAAAKTMIEGLGAKQYSEIWDGQLSQWYKDRCDGNKQSFLANVTFSRAQLGVFQGAEVIDVNYSNMDPSSGYTGDIYMVRFSTTYSNAKTYEQIVVIKEGGEWRLSGFYVTPAQ